MKRMLIRLSVCVAIVVGTTVALLLAIGLRGYFAGPSEEEVHAAVKREAMTKPGAIAWLEKEHADFTDEPIAGRQELMDYQRKNSLCAPDLSPQKAAATTSVLAVRFSIEGGMFASHHLYYWLFYDATGHLIDQRSEDLFIGM